MFEVLAGSRTASPPCFDADFYPFGGEHDFINSCPQNYKFMGKERDPETNNDEFGARSYASAYGRFLSADWSSTPTPVPYANLTNPQTLNLYAMVSDNPESFADLDGHMWMPPEGGCADSAPGSCSAQSNTQTAAAAQNQTVQSANSDLAIQPKQSDLDKPGASMGNGVKAKDVDFDVVHVHKNADGSLTTSPANKDATDHTVTLTENYSQGSKTTDGKICSKGCTDMNVNMLKDHEETSDGHPQSVDKHFSTGQGESKTDLRVFDPATKTLHDYVRVDSSYSTGFAYTYENNPK